jgi:hypothetical protein
VVVLVLGLVVGVLGLELVSVFGLGLVVGFGVLRVGFEVLVVFVVFLVIFLEVRMRVLGFSLGFDGVDSALGWLGWRCYGVLAEGLVVGGGWQVGGVVGVLRDFDGLDGGVGVGRPGLVGVVVVGVLRGLLDDGIRLDAVVSVVGVLGGLGELDGGVSVGVGVGVVLDVVVGVRHGG